jgi:hypothetical protein
MKKLPIVQAIALVVALSFGAIARSQSSRIFDKETFNTSVSNLSDADKMALESIKSTSSRMHENFSEKFKNARDIKVSQVKKHTMISCYVGEKMSRILYNKNGRWRHTITTYENALLPENVRDFVEYSYPRYAIFGGIIEVTVGDTTAYLVAIEDKKGWKRIRVVNGEMDVYEEYAKK